METKEFPIADVLSVTTGKLLSDRRMDGLIDLVTWVSREQPPTAPNGKFEVHWLLTAAAKARDLLIWQHPWLLEVQPPDGIDNSVLLDWLLSVEAHHGTVLTVVREDLFGGAMSRLVASVDSAKQALIELAAALHEVDGEAS